MYKSEVNICPILFCCFGRPLQYIPWGLTRRNNTATAATRWWHHVTTPSSTGAAPTPGAKGYSNTCFLWSGTSVWVPSAWRKLLSSARRCLTTSTSLFRAWFWALWPLSFGCVLAAQGRWKNPDHIHDEIDSILQYEQKSDDWNRIPSFPLDRLSLKLTWGFF